MEQTEVNMSPTDRLEVRPDAGPGLRRGGIRLELIPRDEAERLNQASLVWLDRVAPGLSARDGVSRRQRIVLVVGAVLVAVGLVVSTQTVMRLVVGAFTVVYLATVLHRLWLVRSSLRHGAGIRVTDDEARAVPDDDLPAYTVLVPAYREPEVIGQLIAALDRLDYPRDRLTVKLLLEEDDPETLAAALAHDALAPLDLTVDVLVLPEGGPQTKPRALNFGLQRSEGELVTIFDAEDRPEPLQLRRAVVAFARAAADVACLQARLEFDDTGRNLLSKWFTVEYLTWFRLFIGGITTANGVVPLGGTSNHFRRAALEHVGAWDPYNVTEDADLGVRLQRNGYRVDLLDSVTVEEVNSDVVNWIKQRSRWQKGYLQTAMVHLRHPRQAARDLSWRRVGHLAVFMGGTPILALANLFFWGLFAAWMSTQALVIEQLFPNVVYYLALGSLVGGNLAMVYLSLLTLLHTRRHDHLLGAALLSPLYWVLISIASVRAALQLVTNPFHWEKTQHGLPHAVVADAG